jgi:hypothetical protein
MSCGASSGFRTTRPSSAAWRSAHADPDVDPNSLITERAPIQDFTTWFTE